MFCLFSITKVNYFKKQLTPVLYQCIQELFYEILKTNMIYAKKLAGF